MRNGCRYETIFFYSTGEKIYKVTISITTLLISWMKTPAGAMANSPQPNPPALMRSYTIHISEAR